MAIRRFLRDDYRFVLFGKTFSEVFTSPKQKKTAMQILENSIEIFARAGIQNTTMLMIAKHSGVSKNTLNNYFSTKEKLVIFAIQYTRMLYQTHVVEELLNKSNAIEMFKIYFDSCFQWPKYFPRHSVFWLSFLHICTAEKNYKAINTASVEVGYNRLLSLIKIGITQGRFLCEKPEDIARIIHQLITAQILAETTELKEIIPDERVKLYSHCCMLLNIQSSN